MSTIKIWKRKSTYTVTLKQSLQISRYLAFKPWVVRTAIFTFYLVELWNITLQSTCWFWSRFIATGMPVSVSSINFWALQQEYIFYWYFLTTAIFMLLLVSFKAEKNPLFLLTAVLSLFRLLIAFVFSAISPQWNNGLQVILAIALLILVAQFKRRSAI